MLRVDLSRAVRRWRTWVLVVLFVAVPTLFVVGLALTETTPPPGEGPPFLSLVPRNGIFAGLVGVVVVQPFLLPLAVGLLAGDAIAGEASAGTLRYLLLRPVGRVQLVLSKYAAVLVQVAALVMCTALAGLVVGGLVYGLGPLPTLSGTTLPATAAAGRLGLAAVFVTLAMTALAAVGLFISTLTTSSPAATAATVGVYIISTILDALPALEPVHPWLLTHYSLAVGDLFRSPIATDQLAAGARVYAAYTAVFLVLAVVRFRRKDITA